MTGIRSEAKYSTFEAIAMIVGNSVGTGIIAVPYLAARTSMTAVVIMVAVAYCVNVVLHLIIAELSYNNGGQQLVKSFENELFAGNGRAKQVFSWIFFGIYGLAIMVGVAGNLNGGALILVGWFGMPLRVAQVIYYVTAGVIVFFGMKAVGVAQKYAVIVLFAIVAAMSVGAFMLPGGEGAMSSGGANLSVWTGSASGIRWNNLLALFGVNSFIALTRIMSGVVLLVSLGLILTYSRSRRNAAVSPICGPLGTRPFRILMLLATILSAVGAVITIT